MNPLARRLGAILTIAAISAASVLSAPLAAQAIVPVDFTGSGGLKTCVNTALGAPVGNPVSEGQLATLATLTCTSANITSVAPLAHATSLQFLNLSDNSISDISPLAADVQLSSLYLADNEIVDVTPIAALTQLLTLVLTAPGIDSTLDLAPIASATKLTYLALFGAAIADLTPIASLTKLTQLDVEHSSVSTLAPISAMTGLTTLVVIDSYLSSVAPITGLTNLTHLNLDENLVTDLSPITSMTQLVILEVSHNEIGSLPSFTGMPALRYLHADHNQIADAAPVASRPELIDVWLSNNRISNVAPLAASTGAKNLLLSGNAITDLTPLAPLTGLTQLTVTDQSVELPVVATSQFSTAPTIRGLDGTTYALSIDEGIGFFENGQASWSSIGHTSLGWNATVTFGSGLLAIFSGEVGQMVESPIVAGSASVAGVASVGNVLTAGATGWASNLALRYAWLRDGVATGAAGDSYALGAADGNHAISVRVIGSRSTLLYVSADSAALAIAPAPIPSVVPVIQVPALLQFAKHAIPKIAGTAKVGKKLTAKAGKWDAGAKLSYRWMANGHTIKKATKSTLKLTKSLRHKKITVVVTATKTGYTTLVQTSKATKKVK